MEEKSPSERSTEWISQLSSVWSEVPDASNTCENELTNIVNESNVPQQSEEVEVPQISKKLKLGLKYSYSVV